ncbi:hypothetical protein [Mycobacterium montefiorense]|uniref:Transmembrane protein n=1 Tax=Mycobacterium montefiorense TaxID=154654 RepID=A0AA37PPQ5_9MYCO|nr:hypothetical protein [Mycobacterium montefiorense]GBG40575.1 hypothetical protein MmonteBS_49470 [Mycobacterium montefiorense]GKU37978.1 hypothetical protein NJB14191_53240 [Mycobacterium montefiorense]GKU39256.1 hypothetical protein NJB14192_12510 [Mycobacterium montefiorense]GKU44755.1 hypothetical protein NJB14194_13810 [Mycobacterium montefiorense]GKU53818.1 hypothetical protein NJB14195_50590 [Mycobacterium montefiorense]
MTGPHSETESPGTRPISVAELLARNGTIGSPAVTRRRRRRRGDSDAVTVAELTGEIPVIRDDDEHDETQHQAHGSVEVAETESEASPKPVDEQRATRDQPKPGYWTEAEPRWPKSPPQPPRVGPERSAYPRPARRDAEQAEEPAGASMPSSGAEDMSPDPLEQYADMPVDVMDSEVREAEPATEDSAYVRSYLQTSDSTLFGGQTLADEVARRRSDERDEADADSLNAAKAVEEDHPAAAPPKDAHPAPGRLAALWHGSLIVFQSMLAVAFGAGLFIAFDQLWRWNSLVALVLSVLVILGLVAGVRVVRKTEDIASTLIAVAVGALITLGPLALSMQSG